MYNINRIKRLLNQGLVIGSVLTLWLGVFGTGVLAINTATLQPVQAQERAQDPTDTGGTGGKCGGGNDQVKTIINIGCRERGNPIVDMLFAIIRLLSIGVGIIIIGSLIFAGVQYIVSAGEPAAVAKAIERIRSTVLALLLYIFAYALLNWLIPAGVLQ